MPGIDPGAQGLADIAQAHILRVADHCRRQGAAGIVQLAISGVVLDGIQGAEIPQTSCCASVPSFLRPLADAPPLLLSAAPLQSIANSTAVSCFCGTRSSLSGWPCAGSARPGRLRCPLHIVHTLVLLHRGIAAGIVVDLGQIGADHLNRGLIVAHLFQLLRAGDIVHHAAVHREKHLLKLIGTALFHLAAAMLDQRFVAVFVRLLGDLNNFVSSPASVQAVQQVSATVSTSSF